MTKEDMVEPKLIFCDDDQRKLTGNFIKLFLDKIFDEETDFVLCMRTKETGFIHYMSTMDRADAIKLMRKASSVVEELL